MIQGNARTAFRHLLYHKSMFDPGKEAKNGSIRRSTGNCWKSLRVVYPKPINSSMIRLATRRPEIITVGRPVPGWVLAPTKYR